MKPNWKLFTYEKVKKVFFVFKFLNFKLHYNIWIWIQERISNADPGTPKMRIQFGSETLKSAAYSTVNADLLHREMIIYNIK